MKNLTLENITRVCRGTYHGDSAKLGQEVSGVVIDSRKVEKDNLFVAIDGENVNAHRFIPDTIEKGALCVVSHEDLAKLISPIFWWNPPGRRFWTSPSSTGIPSTSRS